MIITKEEWNTRLNNVNIRKQDINHLILNYLIIEGFKDAAIKFSIESKLELPHDLKIDDRMAIRMAIQKGLIKEAIEMINDLDPEILDTNHKLYFHLQQQHLIELIRNNQIETAIIFAQTELAPRGEEHPEFLVELETTMALLVFDKHSPVGYLLDHSHRQKIASEVNQAILTAQCQEKDPKLPSMLKMLVWAQVTSLINKNQLKDSVQFPVIENLSTGELVNKT